MNGQTSRWYMVNKDGMNGMVTLCADKADAEQEAKDAQETWPHMGPHRAVRLVEVGDAGFTAADMATAAAQGFREGQAAELAAMRAGVEPVAAPMVGEMALIAKALQRVGITNVLNHGAASCVFSQGCAGVSQGHLLAYTREIALQCAAALYTHPQPAAQDAERIQALELEVRQLTEQIAELRHAPTPQADSQPAQVREGEWINDAGRIKWLMWRVQDLEAKLAARAPADSVLEDAARLERERICAAIKAEDDYCVEHGDYMLDSDDCIKIVRGEWVRPDYLVDAARKQGGA